MRYWKVIEDVICNLRYKIGIYRMYDADGRLMYVGKAKDLSKRLKSYTRYESLSQRIKIMVSKIDIIHTEQAKDEKEALLKECYEIKSKEPRYNIVFRDDKRYPYIMLSDRVYPRLQKYRGERERGCYGPYGSSGDIEDVIKALEKIFKVRTCSDAYFKNRKRPCMKHDIGRCSAPCVGKISVEEYQESIEQVRKVLSGNSGIVQGDLIKKMEHASKNMQYELAGRYKDRIESLQKIQVGYMGDCEGDFILLDMCSEKGFIGVANVRGGVKICGGFYSIKNMEDCDEGDILEKFLINRYSDMEPGDNLYINVNLKEKIGFLEDAIGRIWNKEIRISRKDGGVVMRRLKEDMEKKKESVSRDDVLVDLRNEFRLKNIPYRIEVYDNSHIMGERGIGGVVIVKGGEFYRKGYRRYHMDGYHGDDYEMMKDVLKKRIKEWESDIPDLILIDGGIGHRSVVSDVLAEEGIDVEFICIAKGKERRAGKERFYLSGGEEVCLERGSRLHNYIRMLRDEAHNNAIGAHRSRGKDLTRSELESLNGIGRARVRMLLASFGDMNGVKMASIDELANVRGISVNMAKKIREYLDRKI